MGFNFGAALGGFADQVVSDIEDKEKEVKLRTRTILDRHVAETVANRKDYKANKKKVTEQLNSIVQYFPTDDPDRWNKARAIIAGGDSHVAKMNTIFTNAASQDQTADDVYDFKKTSKDIGFKGVEDTANSLVKMAQIAKPSFGAGEQTSTLFGSTNLSNVYEQGRSQYEKAGLLDAPASMSESGATYGSGQLKLSALKKDAKSFDQMLTNAFDIKRNSKPGSAEYIKAEADMAAIRKEQLEGSIALKIAMEQNKTKGNPSTSFYQNTLKQGMLEIENKYKSDLVTGPDGQPIDPMKKDAFKTQAILDYKKKFVDNLVREGIDTNGLTVIQSDPQLNNIYKDVLTAEQDKITGGGGTSSKPITRKEKIATFVKDNPDVTPDVAKQFIDLTKKGTINSAKSLSDALILKYPKSEGESATEHQKRIDNIAISVWSEYSKTQADQTELEKKNKLIREKRFTPEIKSDNSNASGMPNKQSYINNFGPTEGAAKYKAEMIKQLTPNFGSRAEEVFNQMVKDGKA